MGNSVLLKNYLSCLRELISLIIHLVAISGSTVQEEHWSVF